MFISFLWGFLSGGFLAGDVLSRGFLSGGLCPGGFYLGFFCPDTIVEIWQDNSTVRRNAQKGKRS